jgi:hypothetical protein
VPITAGDGPEAVVDGVFLAAVAIMAAIPSSLGAETKKSRLRWRPVTVQGISLLRLSVNHCSTA